MKEIILFGAGGHAKVVADLVKCNNKEVKGFLCNDETVVEGLHFLGNDCAAESEYANQQFIICVGNNQIRKKIALTHRQLSFVTVVHPSAVVAEDAVIGKGTVVMAGAIINPGAVIGEHCIINSGSIIEHVCWVGDYVHVSPRATLGGTVKVGDSVHIGIGATVKNNITICKDVVIGAGAVVVKDICEEGTYVGIPAHKVMLQK